LISATLFLDPPISSPRPLPLAQGRISAASPFGPQAVRARRPPVIIRLGRRKSFPRTIGAAYPLTAPEVRAWSRSSRFHDPRGVLRSRQASAPCRPSRIPQVHRTGLLKAGAAHLAARLDIDAVLVGSYARRQRLRRGGCVSVRSSGPGDTSRGTGGVSPGSAQRFGFRVSAGLGRSWPRPLSASACHDEPYSSRDAPCRF
jgi:hypothetical protein